MAKQPSPERLAGLQLIEPDTITLALRAATELVVGRGGGGRGGGGRGGWGGRGGRGFRGWYGAPGGGWYGGWWDDGYWDGPEEYVVARPGFRPGFGYWHNLAGVPEGLIDESWDAVERNIVAGALEAGPPLGVTVFPTECKVCGKAQPNMALTDGAIDYPVGLAHYVREHAVKIPGDMVARALGRAK